MQNRISPILWIILAILIGFGSLVYFMLANYGNLPSKIEALKTEIELLKAPTDSSKMSTVLDLQKLELKIEKVETSIRSDFFLLQRLGIPLTALAFVLTFWSVYKSALGFALENAKKYIAKSYLPDEELIKLEKKILVLTKKGGTTDFLRDFFQQTGYWAGLEIPKLVLEDEIKNDDTVKTVLKGETYDLILFNDEESQFTNDEIKAILKNTPPFTMIFSYGRPNEKRLSDDLVKDKRVASASFKSQIYGNLINALKYQKYLRQAPKGETV